MELENHPFESDEELVDRYRGTHDRECLRELCTRHGSHLLSYCRALLRDTSAAEDLAAETFLRAIDRLDQFRGGSFAGWLCRIACNLSINERKRWADRRRPIGPDDDTFIDPGKSAEQTAMEEEILAWVNDLPPKQRICVKLCHLDGLTAAEIAEQTGWPVDEIYKLLEKGRATLRQRYQKAQENKPLG
jgi:RNA polymerase sigma-70 factor, ECF subfamily